MKAMNINTKASDIKSIEPSTSSENTARTWTSEEIAECAKQLVKENEAAYEEMLANFHLQAIVHIDLDNKSWKTDFHETKRNNYSYGSEDMLEAYARGYIKRESSFFQKVIGKGDEYEMAINVIEDTGYTYEGEPSDGYIKLVAAIGFQIGKACSVLVTCGKDHNELTYQYGPANHVIFCKNGGQVVLTFIC